MGQFDSDSAPVAVRESTVGEMEQGKLIAAGRVGEVVLHDPSDSALTYKIRFADGAQPGLDWFAGHEVELLSDGRALLKPVCELASAVTSGVALTSGDGEPQRQVPPAGAAAMSTRREADMSLMADMDGKFHCPHCRRIFETAEALYQHDECMVMPSGMVELAKSGNGTLSAVGVKLSGKVQCSECSQKFDSEKALAMHWKFIHNDEKLFSVGYTLEYEFNGSAKIKA